MKDNTLGHEAHTSVQMSYLNCENGGINSARGIPSVPEMWQHWKAIRSTSQLQCPMDGFSSQAWLSSTQTNGESLNELDLHMILISFPALKASINCLEKINRGGIDAARELKRCPYTADSLPIEREKHNTYTHKGCPCLQVSY